MRIFNSRDNECKSPFGSVREGENIHFKITIPRYLGCSSAILALKDDLSGDTVSYRCFGAECLMKTMSSGSLTFQI